MVFAFDNFIKRYKRTSGTVLRERINIQIKEGEGEGGSNYNSYNILTRPLHWPILSILNIIAPD